MMSLLDIRNVSRDPLTMEIKYNGRAMMQHKFLPGLANDAKRYILENIDILIRRDGKDSGTMRMSDVKSELKKGLSCDFSPSKGTITVANSSSHAKAYHFGDREIKATHFFEFTNEQLMAMNSRAENWEYYRSPSMFDNMLAYIYSEMMTNVRSAHHAEVKMMRQDTIPGLGHLTFADLVGGNKPWDHKPILKSMFNMNKFYEFYFCIPGDNENEYFYDIWSNIHYGYIGSDSFFEWELNFFPKLKKPSKIILTDPGIDDPIDDTPIQIGIDLWNKYGENLPMGALHSAILQNMAKLSRRGATRYLGDKEYKAGEVEKD